MHQIAFVVNSADQNESIFQAQVSIRMDLLSPWCPKGSLVHETQLINMLSADIQMGHNLISSTKICILFITIPLKLLKSNRS